MSKDMEDYYEQLQKQQWSKTKNRKNILKIKLSFINIYEIYFGEKIETGMFNNFNDEKIENIYELYGLICNAMGLEPCGKNIFGNDIWSAQDLIEAEIIDEKMIKKYIKSVEFALI